MDKTEISGEDIIFGLREHSTASEWSSHNRSVVKTLSATSNVKVSNLEIISLVNDDLPLSFIGERDVASIICHNVPHGYNLVEFDDTGWSLEEEVIRRIEEEDSLRSYSHVSVVPSISSVLSGRDVNPT